MQIIEKEIELQKLKDSLQSGDSFWIPMYSDPYRHFMNNSINTSSSDEEYKVYSYKPRVYMQGTLFLFVIVLFIIIILNWLFYSKL